MSKITLCRKVNPYTLVIAKNLYLNSVNLLSLVSRPLPRAAFFCLLQTACLQARLDHPAFSRAGTAATAGLCLSAACAAARRATGTRGAEQET